MARPDGDALLMLDFKSGNHAAFEALLRKYFPRILNYVYRFMRERAAAEDLAQEVFMRVYDRASSYTARAKFKTWLYTIAHNVAINELRKRGRESLSLFAQDDEGTVGAIQMADDRAEAPGVGMERDERRDMVKGAINALPDRQREAVILRRYEELSYEEIAKAMGTTVKAVKSLLNRAMEGLGESFRAYMEGDK